MLFENLEGKNHSSDDGIVSLKRNCLSYFRLWKNLRALILSKFYNILVKKSVACHLYRTMHLSWCSGEDLICSLIYEIMSIKIVLMEEGKNHYQIRRLVNFVYSNERFSQIFETSKHSKNVVFFSRKDKLSRFANKKDKICKQTDTISG